MRTRHSPSNPLLFYFQQSCDGMKYELIDSGSNVNMLGSASGMAIPGFRAGPVSGYHLISPAAIQVFRRYECKAAEISFLLGAKAVRCAYEHDFSKVGKIG